MLNNKATEAKYNVTVLLSGTLGVKGDINGLSCHAETLLRMEIVNVGPSNTMDVEGRLRNSPNWYVLTTATGAVTGTVDISTYDFIRYNVTNVDGSGTLYASGFIFNVSSGGGGGGGGDASAANQLAGNATLTQINVKSPGSLLANIKYDDIQVSYPTTSTEQYAYYLLGGLTATIEITYTDSTKAILSRARKL